MKSAIFVMAALCLLSACSGGEDGGPVRFAGLNNCSADGSVVWFERADKNGSYAGLNNGPCKKD